MKNIAQKIGVGAASFLMPAIALAATYQINSVNDVFSTIKNLLNSAIPVIIALTVVYILWGVFQSFVKGSEEERSAGHMKILYGIIALFVMISIWGLVNILVGTVGLNGSAPSQGSGYGQIPTVNNIGQ
jgi:hypothetical protein